MAEVTDLDQLDLRTALAVVEFFRRAHVLSKRPVPPTVTQLSERLTSLLAEGGQETVVYQQDWLTTRQVSARLRCSQRTARRIAAQVGRKAGQQWLIPAEAIPEEER
jgi:hypothetical protein